MHRGKCCSGRGRNPIFASSGLPLPWTTPHAELDVRPGGASLVVMHGPDGNGIPNRGAYPEVVENERLVITDACTHAWEPAENPFMTVILTFDEEDGKTRYTAVSATGRLPAARRTSRWVLTRTGASARTSSPRSSRSCNDRAAIL